MKFTYCPDCGAPLSRRDLGDDAGVPWCDRCSCPWFPVFPTAIIALVHNERGEVLLLRQDYISTEFRNLVSGYMTPGENAEQCARREILDETALRLSSEVDGAEWCEARRVTDFLSTRPGSTSRLLAERFLAREEKNDGLT